MGGLVCNDPKFKTVLFGGTFNPIHKGHTALCRAAFEKLRPDRIVLLPSGHPPHKDQRNLAPAFHRLCMCRIAARGIPYLAVDEREIERSCYTADTLRGRKEKHPEEELYLLLSTDAFLSFDSWYHFEECASFAVLLVGSRYPEDLKAQKEQQRRLALLGVRSLLLENEGMMVSSSEIRRKLVRGETPEELEPEVLCYIREHKLYQSEDFPVLFPKHHFRP